MLGTVAGQGQALPLLYTVAGGVGVVVGGVVAGQGQALPLLYTMEHGKPRRI